MRQHIVGLNESALLDYRIPITTEKLTVAVTNRGYLYLGSLDRECNSAAGVEQELLTLAYEKSVKGVRRVPFELVLALPRVKAQIRHAGEIPDHLVRILDELEQDDYIAIYGITIGHTFGGAMVNLHHNPSISLTEAGKQWMLSTGRTTLGSPNEQSADSDQDGNRLSINPTAFSIPKDKEHSETGL